ncbi:heavy metal-binding domain-containing protein [Patescibacteria group bacterium]|nr:heavy metal-binding domain-containing protein [Patescibacteria group bacterium]
MAKICFNCGKKISTFGKIQIEGKDVCKDCKQEVETKIRERKEILETGKAERVIATTTPTVEDYKITQYLGIVSSEAIFGVDVVKDFFASIRDVWGGRSKTMQREFNRAKDTAIRELKVESALLGGDAVIGVTLDYENITGKNSQMIMVVAKGTAVKIEKV